MQLYHVRDCGTPEEPLIYREFWEVTSRGGPDLVKAGRGPVFNKEGGLEPDWQPTVRYPIYVIKLDEECTYPWDSEGNPITFGKDPERFKTPEDIFSGKFLRAVEHWMTPFEKRDIEARKQTYRDVTSRNESMASEYAPAMQAIAEACRDSSSIREERVVAQKKVERKRRRDSLAMRYGLEGVV